MKKILILGASGMAGHVIYTHLKKQNKYLLFGTSNSTFFSNEIIKLDIFIRKELDVIINDIKPDIVINCIGMLIKDSIKNPDKTIYANSFFPHFLSRLSSEKDFKLIHISTDCVFSGKKGNYNEKSNKDSTDIYGISKALGEIIDDKNLTIRTSIIGPEIKNNGEGLFHWLLNQEKHIYGYKSNIWSGVTTLELAKFIDSIIDSNIQGLVHLTNNTPISKYDFLEIINKIHKLNLIISDEKDYKCDKSFVNTNIEIKYNVKSYENMILDQKEFMNNNRSLYKHYLNKI